MISTLDELRIPVVKGQENLDALLMQQLLKSFDEAVTVDDNGFTSIDIINLPEINYVDELKTINKKKIQQLILQTAKVVYEDFRDAYRARNKAFIEFDEFAELHYDLEIAISSVLLLYDQITSNPVINMNVSNTSKVMSSITPTQALKVLATEANQQSVKLSKNMYAELRRTTKSIIDSGVRAIVNKDGKRSVVKMSSVVDALMRDTITATRELVFDYVDKDVQFDGVEISVHFNSALDHEPVQGHQFSNEEFNKLQTDTAFVDYTGKQFAPIARPIGMWNCRHLAYPVLLGVTKPTFSPEELKQIIDDNEQKVDVLNASLSKHDALGLLSRYTTKAQRAKEQSKEATILGDEYLAQQYLRRYLKYSNMVKTINKALRGI